jgi:hypothetical protein
VLQISAVNHFLQFTALGRYRYRKLTSDELRIMTQAELADRLGRLKEKINDIIKGREPINMLTAHQLENVL